MDPMDCPGSRSLEVEVLKSVSRVLPIWSTGIMPAVIISQHTFPILQAFTMDRRMGPNFQIPPGSFIVFAIITLTLWIAIYDRIIVPQLSKITGRPRGLHWDCVIHIRDGIGNLVGSLLVTVLHRVTGKNGGESWVSNRLNMGHYDYCYWLLAVLSGVNFMYFLVCSWMYGGEGKNRAHAEGEYNTDYDKCVLGDEILLKSPEFSVIL